ncbi:hypothetical protein [Mycobacterium sp. D16Q16]|uniref:hypothetical protein n=1 Tax=Mycobacterium sp. D16Q16 TaxID=1855659 RepID=UPI0009926209|nr:hypothetical protein [Mycobacterium sp. D16Q16]
MDADLVFTIVSHFGQLDVADTEAAVRSAGELAGSPVGVRWSDGETVVWLECAGAMGATSAI